MNFSSTNKISKDMPNTGDSLYRVSIKALIKNASGEVLVVKESGRTSWDLPGGGIDHAEDIKKALARELYEEIGLVGDFKYKIVAVEDPSLLRRAHIWQIRLVFEVIPEDDFYKVGLGSDEISYIDPIKLKDSCHMPERQIFKHAMTR